MAIFSNNPREFDRREAIPTVDQPGAYEEHHIAVKMTDDLRPGEEEKEGEIMYWSRVNERWESGSQKVLISDPQRQNCLVKGEWAYVQDDARVLHKVPVFHNGLMRTATMVDPLLESGVPDEWPYAAEIYVDNTPTSVYVEVDVSWGGNTPGVGEQVFIRWFRDAGRDASGSTTYAGKYPFDKYGAWRPLGTGGGNSAVARVTASAPAANKTTPQSGECIRVYRDATTGNYADYDSSAITFWNMAPEAVNSGDIIVVSPCIGDETIDWYCVVHPCWP